MGYSSLPRILHVSIEAVSHKSLLELLPLQKEEGKGRVEVGFMEVSYCIHRCIDRQRAADTYLHDRSAVGSQAILVSLTVLTGR